LAKPKERTLKRPEEALPPERINLGTVGEIISEWRAISNRNRGRINLGMLGDFARNHQSRATKMKPKGTLYFCLLRLVLKRCLKNPINKILKSRLRSDMSTNHQLDF